jgi:HPt (histidine-containing phosphotransfer) domain-containing protein
MQKPHGAKGTLQGLGFAESMVNTFEQSAKFYWKMWGPLGEPMVRTVDAWADMQRSYLQRLREASVAGGRDAAQRIAREVESSAREATASSFAQMAREAESSAREAQRIAREAERNATTEAEEGPSEEISSVVRESVRRSEEETRDEEPQDATTTDLEENRADAKGPPIEGYDSLNVSQVTQKLLEWSVEEVEQLRDYEAQNRNRSSVMQRFERRLNASHENLKKGGA